MATYNYSKIQVKNQSLKVSLKKKLGVQELVIKKKKIKGHSGITWLADIISELPNGLVHKEETGMGATTLELLASRNSIIVEPIKITASSKAHKHSVDSGSKVLYVGSETRYHPKKITKSLIKQYLNDSSITFKKIIVVADSLSKVIEADKNIFKDFFLLIDEADSFQIDSVFRSSMEKCIDYYKRFDPLKRCLVSATLLDFSDPNLANEPKTVIKYDIPTKRKIEVIGHVSEMLLGNSLDKIKELLTDYPTDKIMVAYNSVKGVYSIAEELVTLGLIKTEDIKILCSRNSKDKVSKYYAELESDVLPARLNFVTSAYFTGFDLNEKFHLVSISGTKSPIHSLSDSRLKQIAGRSRHGLLSETIIHDFINKKDGLKLTTKAELLAAAQTELDAMLCMQKHYNKSPLLKSFYNSLSDHILKTLEDNQKRFIRTVGDWYDYEMAYLNIDAFLENNRTRYNLYQNLQTLFKLLIEQGHQVKMNFKSSTSVVTLKDIDSIDKAASVKEVIEKLRAVKPRIASLEMDAFLKDNKFNTFQSKVVYDYGYLIRYIESESLLKNLKETAEKKDSRQYNNLILSTNFTVLPDGNLYKSRMLKYFPKGSSFKPDEIVSRLKMVFTECSIHKTIDSEVKAVRFLKLHFKCKKERDGSQTIVSDNPFKLKVIKRKTEVEDIKGFTGLLEMI